MGILVMTENKRLFGIVKGHREHIADHTGRLYSDSEVADLLNELNDENEAFKNSDNITELETEIMKLKEENNELQERNNRQCKQLDDLYRLVEQKDWRALSDIMDDFKKADEQLQSEWQIYGDGND